VSRPTGLVGTPSPRAGWPYRSLLSGCRLIGRGFFGFRPTLAGAANLPTSAGRPAGGWIGAGLPHRTWVDPFLVADLLPIEPRLIFFGDGRAMFRSPLRRFLVRRVGGVIPIWPGGGRAAVEAHLAAAKATIGSGAVLVVFPEVGPASELGAARPLGLGLAYIAIRTGAPIVPLVLGGTHELFRGRRLRLEILPACTARELGGLGPTDPLPEPWSSAERALAHTIVGRFHDLTAAAVLEAHLRTQPDPGARRRWRWLTTAGH
jgi:1-acyl-sn-glycerol-3-phosphate acyltransferase